MVQIPLAGHLVPALCLVLSVLGCDSSGDTVTPLAGTFTLTVDGGGTVEGRASGSRLAGGVDPRWDGVQFVTASGGLPEVGGVSYDVRLHRVGLAPGVYPVSAVQTELAQAGCPEETATGDETTAFAFLALALAGSDRLCAAPLLEGRVEVLESSEANTRLRFSFVAVPAAGAGLPDTVRVSGTYTLAAEGR